jgi:Subtilase family
MTLGNNSPSRWARRSSIAVAALAAACLLAPSAATAMSVPGGGTLSPRLAELARPTVRSLPRAEQAERLSLAAHGPGSLLRHGNRVLAEVRFEEGAAAGVEALREAGVQIIDVSPRYQTVTVAAKPEDLTALGEVARVGGVSEVLTPMARAVGCPGGAVVSEGDAQLNAASARANFGVDGSGVTVGILSDSFDQDPGASTDAAGDVLTGDLPGPGNPCGYTSPVNVLENYASSEAGPAPADEGRAMAQIVHDLAPGSPLAFATAFNGEQDFAANIKRLAAPVSSGGAGAQVIADDATYFEEPFFQDGPVAQAVSEVTSGGVSYFSAAGNDNLIDSSGHDIASWEAPEFREAGGCPPALAVAAKAEHCMDFKPGAGVDSTFGMTVSKGATLTVDLQWAEPWGGVKTDLDAFLLDSEGKPLKIKEGSEEFLVGADSDNIKSQRPVEVLQWENDTGASAKVQMAINHCFGECNEEAGATAMPRLKFALLENGQGVTETEYPESSGGDTVGPTVFGHAGAASAIAVGAVPYDSNVEPEPYSSRGPVTHYFGPVLGSAPAAAIPAQFISKPDLVATDCGATTFFAHQEAGIWRFCGTSAATPHAAAVAALIRQANPGASATQVRAALTDTARPLGAFGPQAIGAGLVDADAAVAALALPPTVTITRAPVALSRDPRPTVEFTANRPVAFSCAVDGGAAQPCASPFTVPAALRDGVHGIAVTGTDLAGRVGNSGTVSFTIDTKAPQTFIAKHPPKLIRTRHRRARASFRFRSNETGATFVCKVDRGLLRFCGSRLSRSFDAGKHTLVVKARDAAGNVDRSPAVFHFRVKRVG